MMPEKFITYFLNPVLLNDETAVELNNLTKRCPWFQMAWVLYAKNLKQIRSSEYEKVVKEVATRVSDRKMLFNFLNSKVSQMSIDFESGKFVSFIKNEENENTTSDSLIDRFLSSDSGSLRWNSPGNLQVEKITHNEILERSTEEDEELVTETLANIYLLQKNYEKAIHAFEKLSLKYPEKSIYFATRIKEAEDLRNSN